jgi:hypothetical protein
LEDIETHLRHLDAESDDRVMHLVDSRMQRNAVVDHQHLQQVLNTHQSTLQQTTTGVLTTLQKEKEEINSISSLIPETTLIQHHKKQVQFCPPTAPLNTPPKSPSSTPNEHMQGYSLRKYYANEVYRRNRRTRQQPRPAPNPRRLVCNHRQRPYDPNKRCSACNHFGPDANSCDHLGVSCFIECFHANGANEETIKQAEEAWVKQNDQYLVQPSDGDHRTPSQVLRNYMDKYVFDFETVENEMNWIYFGNDYQDGDDIDDDAIDLVPSPSLDEAVPLVPTSLISHPLTYMR